MPGLSLNLNHFFLRGLACAVLHPGLRTVLLFDIEASSFYWVAGLVRQMCVIQTGREPIDFVLGLADNEENVYGGWNLGGSHQRISLTRRPGLLPAAGDEQPRFIIIPDLSQLNLVAARACVMIAGATVTHLEHYGQSHQASPSFFLLAACPHTEIGAVSPHLLDRFALRLDGKKIDEFALHLDGETNTMQKRIAILQAHLAAGRASTGEMALPAALGEKIRCAAQCPLPSWTEPALVRVLDYFPDQKDYTETRRTLALARLTVVNALLEKMPRHFLEPTDVDAAAAIIGLSAIRKDSPLPDSRRQDIEPSPVAPLAEPTSKVAKRQSDALPVLDSVPQQPPNIVLPTAESQLPVAIPIEIYSPYPEDKEPAKREANPLRLLPMIRRATDGGGTVIGVRQASDLWDLALVPTLLEAAKFQRIRPSSGENLMLSKTDLRSYRRVPTPERLLAVVLDYTSLRDRDWQGALLPYLHQSYIQRAAIFLVQVGAAEARQELRAELIRTRSILIPRLSAAFDAQPGRATPLAHGLNLMLNSLRHALQHGRTVFNRAELIIITDGRGNVPLAASQSNQVTRPVGCEGIDDAFAVARQLKSLKGLRFILLNPQPSYHQELPLELANILGAEVFDIPLSTTSEARS